MSYRFLAAIGLSPSAVLSIDYTIVADSHIVCETKKKKLKSC